MIHAVIADDEMLARQKLRVLVRAEPDIEIIGECASGIETIELVREARPDLLFLDIRMPGMDGFDIIEALLGNNQVLPRIIFTTAYDSYAIRAFDINAVDYLLKPFTAKRFHAAVQRVRESQLSPDDRVRGTSNNLKDAVNGFANRIVFKSRGRILFLPASEICSINAEENYVRLCTESETHLLRETMNRIEVRLDPEIFMCVHRSFIVNLRFLKEVRAERNGDLMVVLINGSTLPVSRSYRARIHSLLHR